MKKLIFLLFISVSLSAQSKRGDVTIYPQAFVYQRTFESPGIVNFGASVSIQYHINPKLAFGGILIEDFLFREAGPRYVKSKYMHLFVLPEITYIVLNKPLSLFVKCQLLDRNFYFNYAIYHNLAAPPWVRTQKKFPFNTDFLGVGLGLGLSYNYNPSSSVYVITNFRGGQDNFKDLKFGLDQVNFGIGGKFTLKRRAD